jgi:hypothetical protein
MHLPKSIASLGSPALPNDGRTKKLKLLDNTLPGVLTWTAPLPTQAGTAVLSKTS